MMTSSKLSLGGSKSKSGVGRSFIGRFGMGLKSASLSLGKDITVVSRKRGSKVLEARGFSRSAVGSDSWEIQPRMSATLLNLFTTYLPKESSGTLVIIQEVEAFQGDAIPAYRERFSFDIRRAFREIKKTRNIDFGMVVRPTYKVSHLSQLASPFSVEVLEPLDPLMIGAGGQILLDKVVPVNISGVSGDIRIRGSLVPSVIDIKGLEVNYHNQGFYIFREGRQIGKPCSFGKIISCHNDYNRARVEVYFPATLDKLFTTSFQKNNGGEISPQLVELVRKETAAFFAEVKKTALAGIKSKKEAEDRKLIKEILSLFKESLSTIHLDSLSIASTPISTERVNKPRLVAVKSSSSKKQASSSSTVSKKSSKAVSLSINIKYAEDLHSRIYSSNLENNVLTIFINVNHPHHGLLTTNEAKKVGLIGIITQALTDFTLSEEDSEKAGIISQIRERESRFLSAVKK